MIHFGGGSHGSGTLQHPMLVAACVVVAAVHASLISSNLSPVPVTALHCPCWQWRLPSAEACWPS